jgi:integrase
MAQIASLMRAIAKHWVGAGATTIVPLKRAQRLYAPDPFQVSSKNRTRVQQLKDPNNLFALVTLPQQIARQFEAMRAPKMRDVYDLEAALLIEIELMFPIRLRNLSRLVLGDQVRVIGRGTGRQIAICIPREEVKNSVDLLARLPPQSTSLYDLYMKLARPRITSAPSSFLFPSESGDTHRHQATLSRRVTRVIRKRTGMDLNVHCFRHVAAYTFLGEHIGAYEDLRRILGHTTIGTSVRYYADLETQTAVDRLHQSILNVRKYAAA